MPPSPSHPRRGLALAAGALVVVALGGGLAWTLASGPGGTVAAVPATERPADPAVVALGQSYTYPDGLRVGVAVARSFDPGRYYPRAERGVVLTVTVTNGTDAPVAVDSIGNGPRGTFNGAVATPITDPDDPAAAPGMVSSTVLPGKSFVYHPSFAVDAAPGELQLEWRRGPGSPPAVFTGQA